MTIDAKTEYKKFISSTVDFHNFEHAVEIAEELGLGIEISRFGKLSELDEKFDETLKNYKAILKGFKGEVSLHGFFSNLAIASKDSAIKQISIKAKTKEKLDAVGESKAVEANAVVMLERIN